MRSPKETPGKVGVSLTFFCPGGTQGTCGAFDLTTLWGVDSEIAADMVTVFALIARISSYPDSLGYESDFKSIVGAWRPELVD